MVEKQETRKYSFNPGAMSIIQMGEELIGHPSTAINELVKNGYDADAKLSRVYFQYDSKAATSFAFIFDDGTGMSGNTLFGEWLQPSVSKKRKLDARSEVYKRHFLGSKGIGRFAAMALGRYTTVITKRAEDSLYSWITVDRKAFKEDLLLSETSFPGGSTKRVSDPFTEPESTVSREVPQNDILIEILKDNQLDRFSNGTLIVIESLDQAVMKILEEDFKKQTEQFDENLKNTKFYRGLATLITPINLCSDIQRELLTEKVIRHMKVISDEGDSVRFSVEFGTNLIPDQCQRQIEWQKVETFPIVSVYDYRVFGKVKADGDVEGYFIYNRLENDTHKESFEITRKETEDSGLSGKISEELPAESFQNGNNTGAGEYYFDIRVYDIGESDNLDKLARLSGFDKKRSFRSAFKNFQGLRVAKNGFGVKPYGAEVEDWIDLSKVRVQDPGHNVNTNQILGYVFLYSPENDSLHEKTNREGFVENTAFLELKNTLQAIFHNIGSRRYNYRLLHGLGRIPQSKHTRPDFMKFINEVKESGDLEHIRQYSEKFMKDVTTSMDNLEESLTFSERLASLGTGIELVYHEMAQPISRLRTTEDSLSLKKDKVQKEVRENFDFDINSLAASTGALSEFRKSLQPAIGRSRKKKFKPYDTFLKVCSLYKSDFDETKISIKADERIKNYSMNNQEYAFWIAFLNIVNNAVYWIKKSEKPGEIRLHLEGGSLVVSNSGPFIREDIIGYIFEYGVTIKNEKHATGLGLSFTRSILSTINWQIVAENRTNGPAFIMKETGNE